MASYSSTFLLLVFSCLCFLLRLCLAADLVVNYDFVVSYILASPLGIPEKVIAINREFPGPPINVTTNNIVSVNVQNDLDESILFTWQGIQMRGNCWQDGVPGTNCPIPAGWNWTYSFQVKDQIGSYFYYLSLNLQRARGGFGGFVVNPRPVIPASFFKPEDDIFLFISDWYAQNHTTLAKLLDDGRSLGMPDGVLFNGKGSCQYNATLVPDGIDCTNIILTHGKRYRLRVYNVGVSKTLNLRIQNHTMALVETEGSYTNQQNYTNLDIHVGQSYSFLLTMDQSPQNDYYIVASVRFVNVSLWQNLTSVALLCYHNCKSNAKLPLPAAPDDEYDKTFSMNQARSIRWNVTASAARPNPQGSFKYGNINVTELYVLKSKSTKIGGKRRMAINGVSFVNPSTPMKLADAFRNMTKPSYTVDFPNGTDYGQAKMKTSIINGTYKGFMEIILQNNDTDVRSYHLDGYAFFVVGMDYGEWTENSRDTYNKWDGVARSTTQVFPNAWTAILVSLDNVGIWNLRVENLDSHYLGQETYIMVVNPEANNKTELTIPSNALYCGALQKLQKKQRHHSAGCRTKDVFSGLMMILCSFLIYFLQ